MKLLLKHQPADVSTSFSLVIARPGMPARRVANCEGEIILGRGHLCDVLLEDPVVSRLHVAVRRSNNAFVVRDLGSRNGTRVNDISLHNDEASVPGPTALMEIGPYLIVAAA